MRPTRYFLDINGAKIPPKFQRTQKYIIVLIHNAVADLHNKIFAAPSPSVSKFFQVHAVFGKSGKISVGAPGGLASPPRANPGSVTAML